MFRIRHHMLKYLMYTKRMIYVLPQRRNNSDGSGKGSMTGSRAVEGLTIAIGPFSRGSLEPSGFTALEDEH